MFLRKRTGTPDLKTRAVLGAIACAAFALGSSAAEAQQVVNISATQNGEDTGGVNCSVACEGALIDPVQVTLGPGTYSITDAYSTSTGLAAGALYDAWNYSSGWVWHWKALLDDGSGGSTINPSNYSNYLLLDVDPTQVFGSEADAAAFGASTPAQTFTLNSTTTVDFVVNDYFLGDNTGGVSLLLSSVSSLPEPSTWAMMLIGFGAVGFALKKQKRNIRLQTA
jgi:hypothetical protein